MPASTSKGRAATAAAAVRRRPVRLLGIAQLGLGCLLTVCPGQVAASAAGPSGQPAPRWLVRVLGLRSLAQGAVSTAAPVRTVLLGGSLVDATHAASMMPFIAASRRYRRAAAISALTATVSAVTGAMAAGQGRRGRNPAP